MLNKTHFAEQMTVLCELYDKSPSKALLKLYYEILKSLSDEQLSHATKAVVSSNKYPSLPKPAEILEFAYGSTEDKAQIALEKVEKAMFSVGAYQSICFDDPILHRVVERLEGGWQGICMMPLDEWKWAKKDFIKMYQSFAANMDGYEYAPLIGMVEHDNKLNNYLDRIPKPVYIGDKQAVTKLLDNVTNTKLLESADTDKQLDKIGG